MLGENFTAIANRNERYAHVVRFLNNIVFSLPIWILFFSKDLGIDLGMAIILGSTRWIVAAALEMPTGSWADRYSRLALLRIGLFGSALTFVPFLLTKDIYILFAAQIIGGLFSAMCSGVLDPLVRDSFTKAKFPEKKYKKYLSTNNTGLYTARVLSSIAGGFIYSKYAYGPYILDTIFGVLAVFFTFGLTEVWVKKSNAKNNYEQIKNALKYTWRSKYLTWFLVMVIIFTFTTEAAWTSLQPIFSYKNVQPQIFGILFGLISVASALGAYVYRFLPEKVDGAYFRVIMMSIFLLSTIFMQFKPLWSLIIFITLAGISFGFSTVNAVSTIQKNTDPSHQSTMLSFNSMLGVLFYSLGSIVVGGLIGLFGIEDLIRILLVLSFLGFLLLLIIYKTSLIKCILVKKL